MIELPAPRGGIQCLQSKWGNTGLIGYRIALLVLALLAGCADLSQRPSTQTPAIPSPPVATYPPPPSIDLPCVQTTHGCIALNPDVTIETLGRTICVPGYTSKVRP